MKPILAMIFILICNKTICGDFVPPDNNNSKKNYKIFIGYDFYWYNNNSLDLFSDYRTSGYIVGCSIQKEIWNKFSLNTKPSFGVQISKEKNIINKVPVNPTALFQALILMKENLRLDEIFINPHYFAEIPIILNYSLSPKIDAGFGLGARYYFPVNINDPFYNFDFLQHSLNYFMSWSIDYYLTRRFGIELCFKNSINNVYSSYLVTGGNNPKYYDMNLRYRELLIKLSFAL
jgi:hypothetical protein